jgi:hypothetical protein
MEPAALLSVLAVLAGIGRPVGGHPVDGINVPSITRRSGQRPGGAKV